MVVNNIAIDIDKIFARPIFISKGIPGGVVVIKHDWEINPKFFHSFFYVSFFFLKSKFRRMNANHNQSVIFVFFIPCGHIRKRALTIDARVGHDIK